MLLCLCLVVSCLAGLGGSASAADTIDYYVKNGDYLYKVCRQHGLDYYACKKAIMILNGWSSEASCNLLTPGQKVILPASNAIAATVKGASTTSTSTTSSVTINGVTYSTTSTSSTNAEVKTGDSIAYYLVPYTVKSGDYLAKICSSLGTSYTAYKNVINGVNGLSGTKIYSGKTLYIPVTTPPSTGSYYAVVAHRVDNGDTMNNICAAYNTTATSMMTKGVNSGINLNYLYAGQVVYVPVTASAVIGGTGGSSSTPVDTGFDINLLYDSTGGIPTAKVGSNANAKKAEAGKQVTISANAKEGYAQRKITVIRKDTNANVVVTNNTFTMPPCAVDVKLEYAGALKITMGTDGKGTIEATVNGESVQYANYGDKVVLKFHPDSGYTVDVVKKDGAVLAQNADGSYSFTMPNKAVQIDVTYKAAVLENITYDPALTDYTTGGDKTKAGTVTFTVDSVEAKKAAKDAQVIVNIKPNTNYTIDSVKYGSNKATKQDDTHYTFKMPDADTTVTVTYKYTKTYAISCNSNIGGKLYFSSSDTEYKPITRAALNQVVYITATPNSGRTKIAASKVSATYANGATPVTITAVTGKPYDFTITMPAADIKVNVSEKWPLDPANKQYTIKKQYTVNGTITAKLEDEYGKWNEGNSAIESQTVRVYFAPKQGYEFERVEYLKADGSKANVYASAAKTDAEGNYYVEVSMPKCDTVLTGHFTATSKTVNFDAYSKFVGVDSDNNVALTITNLHNAATITTKVNNTVTNNAFLGSVVKLVIPDREGYKVREVNLTRYYDDSTTAVEKISSGTNNVSYTIKDADALDDGTKKCIAIQFEVVYQIAQENKYKAQTGNATYNLLDKAGAIATEFYPGEQVKMQAALGTFDTEAISVFKGSGASKTNIPYEILSGTEIIFTMPTADVNTDATAS